MKSLERMLQERIQESKKIHAEIANALPSHFPDDDRLTLARCAISLALEHHAAIIKLIENGLYPSAQAMLRPLLEAGTISYWILYVAKKERIEDIARSAPLEGAKGNADTPNTQSHAECNQRRARAPSQH